jgi:ADP-ribose pyrophosphatase YjhB (NUDIX family)
LRTKDQTSCVILNEAGQVLLVHHGNVGESWSLPDGVVDGRDSAWEAAIRNCREDLSLLVDGLELKGLYHLSHRDAYCFLFKIGSYTGTPSPDGRDVDEVRFFDVDNLPYPMSNFTARRIFDAVSSNGPIHMREQNLAEYRICRE